MSLINDALKRASNTNRESANSSGTQMNTQTSMRARPRVRTRPGGGVGMTVILICFVIAGAVTLGAWAYWNRQYQKASAGQAATANASKPAATQAPAAAARPAPAVATAPAAAASKTNNNPIARAANTLRKVEANNNDGERIADSMRTPAPAPAPTTPAPTTAPVAAAPTTRPTPAVATPSTPAPAPAQAHVTAPATAAQPQAAAPAGPKLQAIFFRQNNPSAIINGKTVREGDEIAGGFEVMEIKRNSVRIQKGADSRDLTLR